MSKYKKLYDEMVTKNEQLFTTFTQIHELYKSDPKSHKEEFNKVGMQVMEVIKEYENILCGKSENNGYGKYSANLADKFMEEIRSHYSRIDFVGVK